MTPAGHEPSHELTVLPGGITVLSETMEGVRSIALGLWFAVGSRDETGGVEGMSHFIEHMLFKGTKTRSAKDISDVFEGLGAELNAFTSKEYTCYYSRFLDEHLERALEVMADMVLRPSLKREHVLSEREVVLEEMHLHDDTPDESIHDVFAQALMPGHPLGKRILGRRETVGAFGSRQTRDYYRDFYSADRLTVAAAGSVEHWRLVELVERYLGRMPCGGGRARSLRRPPPRRAVAVKHKDTEQAHICLGTLGLDAKSEDRFTLSVMDSLLGGGMSSRLFQEIREKKGLAYAVYSYHSLFSETGAVTVYGGTRPGNAVQVVELIREELARLREEPVGAGELAQAKEHLKGQLMLGLESTRNRMTRLGKAHVVGADILTLDELVTRIEAVDAGAVQALAERLFDPDSMVLAVIGPFDSRAARRLGAAELVEGCDTARGGQREAARRLGAARRRSRQIQEQ